MAVKEPGDRTKSGAAPQGEGPARPASDVEIQEPHVAHRLLANTGYAWIWTLIRLYVGGAWLIGGTRRLIAGPAAFGTGGDAALAWIQLALGAAVVLGVLTGISVVLGSLLGFNLFVTGGAGQAELVTAFGIALILAWRVAGWWGFDRMILPACGCAPREGGRPPR